MFNNLSEENQRVLAKKINDLEKALILETRADERLRLRYEIDEAKALKNKSSSINLPKINNNQYTTIIEVFILLMVILMMWVSLEKIAIHYLIASGVFLFIVRNYLFYFIEKQLNKKIYAQNETYSKKFVGQLQKKLLEKDIKIKLLDEQIKALEEMICHIFDALINLSSTAVSKKEIEDAFNKIKNNDIKIAKNIFEKLRKLSKGSKNLFDEAKYLRYLSIINVIDGNQKLAKLFYEESKKIAPNDPEIKKLDIIFSNEKALFPNKKIIYNPKIIYPVPTNGEVDLRRIRKIVQKIYEDCKKHQQKHNNIKFYIKFGLEGGLGKEEPQEGEDLRSRYEVVDKEDNLIRELSKKRVAERKSKQYSLEEFEIFLDACT